MRKTVYVVSDLHMYCRRSCWEQHISVLHEAADEADMFIFNGDTFDFKWTSLGSVEETVEAGLGFLRTFALQHDRCQIHVNIGNHDHVPAFMEGLESLQEVLENFSWHPYFLRLNNSIFLHGDVANWKMKHHHLERYRASWMHHKKQSDLKNRVYDAAFRAKAHVAISRLAFPHRRTAKRVAAYLDDIGHGCNSGIEQVCFGHTHVPVSGYQYRGVTFHNGGAPMPGMEFTLLKVQV